MQLHRSEKKHSLNTVQENDKDPDVDTRKMLILSCLVSGGLALLLWAILRIPRKSPSLKIGGGAPCSEDETECPHGWNHIDSSCFFKSSDQQFWRDGQEICEILGGNLAMFNTRKEVISLMQLLGSSSYWIGLKKYKEATFWTWANGERFNNWFTIKGRRECVFLSTEGAFTTICNETKKYICSQKSFCP
ncbi:early activation antigen CD69-like [Erinaceus europaeus]|uniref:Early activation antigen CD69-like n=1 Tax=Erinaceus europaeus TaxID=9365 RepID=A0ABM3XKR9_ERIEU|nr:early activation antigen CD69-like [Erinaceus europaeus]